MSRPGLGGAKATFDKHCEPVIDGKIQPEDFFAHELAKNLGDAFAVLMAGRMEGNLIFVGVADNGVE